MFLVIKAITTCNSSMNKEDKKPCSHVICPMIKLWCGTGEMMSNVRTEVWGIGKQEVQDDFAEYFTEGEQEAGWSAGDLCGRWRRLWGSTLTVYQIFCKTQGSHTEIVFTWSVVSPRWALLKSPQVFFNVHQG